MLAHAGRWRDRQWGDERRGAMAQTSMDTTGTWIRKRAGALIAAAVVALGATLAACGGDDEGSSNDTGKSSGEKSFKLGYSPKTLDNAFMALLQKQAMSLAREQGIDTLPPINANGDAAKQFTDIRTLITQGAEALIVVPTDGKAIVPAIEYANSKDVPVVTIDDAPFGGGAYMVVRTDNYQMGVDACEEMGKRMKGRGTVLELQGDLATPNGLDRSNGFEDCMKEKFPNIKVVSKAAKWDPAVATTATQTIVGSTPDLGGIFMPSDSVYQEPVLKVLRKAGKTAKVGAPGHIVLVSIDGSPIALDAIRDNVLDAAVSQPLDLYAKYGVFYARAAAEGRKFKLGPTDHDSKIVRFQGGLEDALPGPLVTKENADDPKLWGNQKL
jgi:ribose transport system substrate-binding protein